MPVVKPVIINKKNAVKQSCAHDFAFLRQAAIALVQQMAGEEWTDYNLHDPGVTIIEQLCYAITDLAYRTGFSIKDLLTDKNGHISFNKNSFHHREEILFSGVAIANDYRKLLIDRIDEIDNAWLAPVYSAFAGSGIRGLYRLTVQVNKATAQLILKEPNEGNRIKEQIKSVFVAERKLGEDLLHDVVILKPVAVEIKADVLIKDQVQPEHILAEIYSCIDTMLRARVRYFTEEELIAKGYTMDQIYAGPRLSNGIIPDSELKKRKTRIDYIELVRLISAIEGVLHVKQITITANGKQAHNSPLEIDKDAFAFLDDEAAQGIRLFTSKYQVKIRQAVYKNLLIKLNAAHDRRFISSFYSNDNNLTSGTFRNPGKYFSLQNYFPAVYGLGEHGLPAGASEARKAQVKQLKGFLMLFEQVLANYLEQLANVQESFSTTIPPEKQTNSFSQPLYDVPGAQEIIKQYQPHVKDRWNREWEQFVADPQNGYMKALEAMGDSDLVYQERRTRQLNHMLARFNELLPTYPVRSYRQIYHADQPEEKYTTEMKWKSYYLSNIVNIHRGENRGLNYLNGPNHSTTFNFEKKIKLLLCLNYLEERRLSAVFEDPSIKIESATQNSTNEHQSAAFEESYDTPDLFLSARDTRELFRQNKIKSDTLSDRKEIAFKGRDKQLFAAAINFGNYKIAPHPEAGSETACLLLFKYEADEQWEVIGRYASGPLAVGALKKLVKYFRKLSLDSEGFYVVEHILLRPSLQARAFGFRLTDHHQKRLLYNREWVDFNTREAQLQELLQAAQDKDRDKTHTALVKYCYLDSRSHDEVIDLLFRYASERAVAGSSSAVKGFEMLVRNDEGPLNESFFNFQVTVVLPSWPARFQDHDFREYVRDIFILNIPANIRLNFKWLSPSKMKIFEDEYDVWRKSFRDETEEHDALSRKLISFLQNN